MKNNIMFVDGSVGAPESFKWALKDEPYRLFVFNSPVDALNALKAAEFAVVMVDQALLKEESIEFLKTVKKKSPDTATIMLFDSIEIEVATNVLGKGYVNQFIKKPLDNKALKQAVEMAIKFYQIRVESKKLMGYSGNPNSSISTKIS